VLECVRTHDHLADKFTKALSRVRFLELCEKIGVVKLAPFRCVK
jgi:hypothetical protein